ncbi:metallophosphoesterase [Streptococcus pneumoniae]|uniref:metallophosphoesterase n=1 Tax=Streptococcus pseudopneumoniae TaxID=257758 RepID=UPI0010D43336|nr:Ser/Thr protein phosphatase [Streptococcus pneumoniae]VRW38298.1 Ser/Thr protein phosphatase [Streptococcus pneumoniae]
MKTLLIGDLHLKSQLILPIVDKIIQTHNIKRIIFLGDYVDLHGQTNNIQLYAKDLTFLYSWKIDKEQNGIDVINLIGNHDAYYLLGEQAPFSIQNLEVFFAVKELLQDLKLQVAYQLDDYLVSHAGFNLIFDPKEWHFNLYTKEHEEELDILAYTIGPMRGGKALGGLLYGHILEN